MPHASRLFTFTSWVVRTATVLCLALAALLMLAVGAVLAAALHLFAIPLPASVTGGLPIQAVLLAAAMVIVACVVIVGLVAVILILVGRIVESASAGDPFVVKNAERLNGIGLLMLAIQVVGLVAHVMVDALPKAIHAHLNFGFELSLSGLLSALLVFVLAQIFRHGAQMRDELEGTV
jgi:hypothetical protein